MDAKVLGLCSVAVVAAACVTLPFSASQANTRSESGVYEAYRRYSRVPANDFWYYHPGGPFYPYAHRRYAYAHGSRHAVWRAHRHAGWHGAPWRRQYAWHARRWGWAQRGAYGGWGGSLVDGKCWSGEPSAWGWREIHVC
ncbi:MAG: hypothetical protein JOY67_23100 [Hyphomicrobiales bacterium]|nr:hypothetical protein [Hyphomicrobiales bacterium]MBV9115711.1 hypothetical protein [Hyphomicrobiales bacterium]MBV9519927.1 hypothetical protein [Hyphomicrobiales bacterium]